MMNGKEILVKGVLRRVLSSEGLQQFLLGNETVVFVYHDVHVRPSEFHTKFGLSLTPEAFEDQLSWIKRSFHVISPQEFLTGNYERPAALITFDDGAKGCFDYAFPVFERLQCPALIFLNMAPVLGEVFWSGLVTYLCLYEQEIVREIVAKRNLKAPHFLYLHPRDFDSVLKENSQIIKQAKDFYGPFATEKDLKGCEKSGLVYFGNHLWNHYNATQATDEELTKWFRINQAEIDRYSNGTRFFSYPFGQKGSCFNERTNAVVRALGTQAIFGSSPETFSTKGDVCYRLPMTAFCKSEQEFKAYLAGVRMKQIVRGAW